ncbi:hypothetical protein [Halobacillus trueperi]|nr:hypothetical protein [Halobacillus trueperi]
MNSHRPFLGFHLWQAAVHEKFHMMDGISDGLPLNAAADNDQ